MKLEYLLYQVKQNAFSTVRGPDRLKAQAILTAKRYMTFAQTVLLPIAILLIGFGSDLVANGSSRLNKPITGSILLVAGVISLGLFLIMSLVKALVLAAYSDTDFDVQVFVGGTEVK